MQTNSCSSSHDSKTKGLLFGLLLVVAGLLFLSFNFEWIDPALRPVIFSWPMIFIVIGIVGFSKNNYIVSLFWLILGGFFLLPRIAAVYPGSIRGIDTDFTYTYWPLLLILFGIGFILKVVLEKRRRRERGLPGAINTVRPGYTSDVIGAADTADTTGTTSTADATGAAGTTGSAERRGGLIEREVIFGGSESIFLDPVFHGGRMSAIFGGIVLDLRRTQLPEGVTYLDVEAIFGGVELRIPEDWLVEAKFQTVFGGLQDKRLVSSPDNSRKLIIQGDLIFGGCEIR